MGAKKIIKIILDTNFLIYCSENRIDYKAGIEEIMNEGYELVVPTQVIHELEEITIKSKKYSDREAAKLALKLLRSNKVERITPKGSYADKAILSISKGNIVATLDLALRKKLSQTIIIQSKKKLALD